MKRFERHHENQEGGSLAKRRKVGTKDQYRLQVEDVQRQEILSEGAGAQHSVRDFSQPDVSGSHVPSRESGSHNERQHPFASIIARFEARYTAHASAPRDQEVHKLADDLASGFLSSLKGSREWTLTLAREKGIDLEGYTRQMREVRVQGVVMNWVADTMAVEGATLKTIYGRLSEADQRRYDAEYYAEPAPSEQSRPSYSAPPQQFLEQPRYTNEQPSQRQMSSSGGDWQQAEYNVPSQQWYGTQEQYPSTIQPDSLSQGKGKAVEYFQETTPVVQSYDDPLQNFYTIGGKTELANAKIILLGESHTPQHHKDIVDFINAYANHGDIILVEGISAGQEVSKEEYLRLVARTQRTEPRSLSKDVKIYGWDDASLLREERTVVTNIKALQTRSENRSKKSSSQDELHKLRNSYHDLLQRRTENMVRSTLYISARLSDGKLFGIAGRSHVERAMMQKDLDGQGYIALTPRYEPTEKEKQDFQGKQESIMRKGTSK